MKTPVWILALFFCTPQLPAQTEPPVHLAIVAQSADSAAAADLLTAELSGNQRVRLLERNEIDRVYREQGLSAANKDFVKLGRVLGADGVLLLESAPGTNKVAARTRIAGQTNQLDARLVAVRPGVVLTAERFFLSAQELSEWAPSFANHLLVFLPKLFVTEKEAVPISVVNLRSAVSSKQAAETERQVTLLVIQRLSRQPRLFVLERQQLHSLAQEKMLRSDDSDFWHGAYLLEGVIDQNGFSKDFVTIHARMTPPKGGVPLTFEVSGPRTNLSEVVNDLVAKLSDLLRVHLASSEWIAKDEAAQYFAEAQWALRWRNYAQSQAAIESAWALGKQDVLCAVLRVKAYVSQLSEAVGEFQLAEYTLSAAFNSDGKPLGPTPSDARVQETIRRIIAEHKFAVVSKVTTTPGSRTILYSYPTKLPMPENIGQAMYVLQLFDEFCHTSSEGMPKLLTSGNASNAWHNSEWYQAGLDALVAGSKVLRSFNLVPESQPPVTEKLAELRALCRIVASTIFAAPSVRDGYFVGPRVATHDELTNTMQEQSNIFRCKLDWGGYWLEKPEEQLALYRELLSSPVFCYIHDDFWAPKQPDSHLVAWNNNDRKRLPDVWNAFIGELANSTNLLWQMESKALLKADAVSEEQARAAEAGWWGLVRANRADLIANNVELFYSGWGFAYNAETEAMNREYWQQTVPARNLATAFEQQKQYLLSLTPYDFVSFNSTFQSRNYTKSQATEILPLIAAYKSNLLAQLPPNAPWQDKAKATNAVNWVGVYLEQPANRALNPPAAPIASAAVQKPATTVAANPQRGLPPGSILSPTVSNQVPELVANALIVRKFLPIPLEGLPGEQIANVTITSHHWVEGKLVIDFQYGAFVYETDGQGNWKSTRNVTFTGISILDPLTQAWKVMSCPERDVLSRTRFYHHTTLVQGSVFSSDGGQLRTYDAVKSTWQTLDLPEVGNCELFNVNGRLFAATQNLIAEILDGGRRMKILASNRRQPPASALDPEPLGTPALFAGPGQSLRTFAANRVWESTGTDWRMLLPALDASTPPSFFDHGVLFVSDGGSAPAGVWRILFESDQMELCLSNRRPSAGGSDQNVRPTWQTPAGIAPSAQAICGRGKDLFLMIDHAKFENIVNEAQHLIVGRKVLAQNGYHAELLCFAPGNTAPQKVFLRFNAQDSSLPVSGDDRSTSLMGPNRASAWLLFSSNYLFCGRENFDALLSGGGDPTIKQAQTGVWLIPTELLDSEIIPQRQAQAKEQARSEALAKEARQVLIRQYDQNHNGVVDPSEREAALDNPAFIKAELGNIDANHNGWLDPEELAWFDANQSKTLDPKEVAGIDLAQQALAEKLLLDFDANQRGALGMLEYRAMLGSTLKPYGSMEFDLEFHRADANHDGMIDLPEIKTLLQNRLRAEVQRASIRGKVSGGPTPHHYSRTPNLGEDLKTVVEAYWQGEVIERK